MPGASSIRSALVDPLIRNNPVTLQILGICSALAVTTSLATALTMSVSLTVVITLSAFFISTIRRHIPDAIRLIVQIIIISTLVIVIDQVLQAYFSEMSRALSVYVGLITTNCLVLGRSEAFARHNAPLPAMADAFGNGLGYSLALLTIGGIRELLGKGEVFGWPVFALSSDGGWFTPLGLMLLAPSGFFLMGGLVWAVRSFRPEQVESPEHDPPSRIEAAE